MSNEWLEKLARSLAGETLSSGAAGLGAGIGYAGAGGQFADIPDVMREEIEAFKRRTQPKSKNEQDAMEVLTALSVLPARLNPLGVAGHTIDFVKATPEMVQAKLSGAEPRTGEIMQGGLKRRLAKGGAQAEYARSNQLERAKANIQSRGLMQSEPEAFMPLQSKNTNWGPGEGTFQSVNKYTTSAYDLSQDPSIPALIGMGKGGTNKIISGNPHELGVEFSHTPGLDPRYRDKGYGKQIYQNMADQYGGGISDYGSTTPAARHVYKSLGGIDTGIPSGGGTRQALPTTAMKADPEAMAAFQQKVKEYSAKKFGIDPDTGGKNALIPQIANLNQNERSGLAMDLYRRARDNDNLLNKNDILLLLNLGHDRVQIAGSAVNEIFGNWLNFRKQMEAQGFNVKYDTVTRLFDITRKP